ncbi:murein transglycosylase [Speluncibacter jeojiensis]|uniref:Murein transglycosylase n=1 Tax=Speluncibacter jeojiensis TaxID=2710754 RepID=A0A9X4M1U6_9ACTN|nr:murein transglycosylase [Corynebacteriales bacterium D3-21]
MGRHSVGRHRKPAPQRQRSAAVAMALVVPAGLITIGATTAAGHGRPSAAPVHNTWTVGLAGDAVQMPADQQAPPAAAAVAVAAVKSAAATHQASAPVAAPAPAAAPAPVAPPPVSNAPQDGIPGLAYDAYHSAERALSQQDPACGLPWTVLAGIGRIESNQGNGGQFDEHGTMLTPIYGPALDGSLPGNEIITDGSGYARAEGPMQFMPTTWAAYAAPGANPQNIYDAALTAGKYLCSGGENLRDIGGQTHAILRYNHSMAYVANVLAWSTGYATGIAPLVDSLPKI